VGTVRPVRVAVVRCVRCHAALTGRLIPALRPRLDPAAIEALTTGHDDAERDVVHAGSYLVADEAMAAALSTWDVEPGDLLVAVGDERGTTPVGRRVGCCGVDGVDRPNTACANGHPVGTTIRDCWTPHLTVLDRAAVSLIVLPG